MSIHHITLIMPDGVRTFDCRSDAYILGTALQAEIDLPYLCLQGWCTTCAARLLQGRVDPSDVKRIYPEDQQAGFVLICTSYPRSDLTLLTHQQEAMRQHRLKHGLPVPRGGG